MVLMNTGSIAERAYNRIDSVPAAISGTVMQNYAEEATRLIENYTGTTIGTTSIGTSHQNILINLCSAYTLSRMIGIGVDFNYSLGDFSVNKGGKESPESKQVETWLNLATMELKLLGRKISFYKSNG